jgi:hypothetical protein
MCLSELLFQIAGHCFRERLTRSAAGLFHQAETLGFGTLPFPCRPTDAHPPQGGKQPIRPEPAIGPSPRAIGATESSIDGRC